MNGSGNCSSGLRLNGTKDLNLNLGLCTSWGYDFLVGPLVNQRYKSFEGKDGIQPFTRSDLLLNSGDWASLYVALLSQDVNIESSVQSIRRIAEKRLQRELTFASHLGLSAIIIKLRRGTNVNLSRNIYGYILKSAGTQIWLRCPIEYTKPKNFDDDDYLLDAWETWNSFRGICNHEKRLSLALEITNVDIQDTKIIERWLGEPIKVIIIPTKLFLANKKGYPVLPKNIQKLVRYFIPFDVQCIIEGRSYGHEMRFYQQYLDHLWQQQHISGSADPLKQFARGYEDFLQSPLQPLMDNLESGTYEVFEKDPIKYTEYQRATYKAIVDRIPEAEKETKTIVVMVLGAGRGPLVRAALKAAEIATRKIKVFAVEKNPNAIVTLLTQKEECWGDQVTVISSDMREWKPKDQDKADIIISELLGSFGDNELSPECLYSAQHLFKPDAISIPSSYTSFVGPLQSSKLYNEVRNSIDRDKNPHANFETPYVVHLQNRTEISEPKPLFTFDHPLDESKIDNTRYEITSFPVSINSELHGFGGYFECTLYKDVNISINPKTHSKGMFSWFPIFFPLNTPIKVYEGDNIELHFWRLNNGKKVWYEWAVSKPVSLPIHNPNGRSYTIGL